MRRGAGPVQQRPARTQKDRQQHPGTVIERGPGGDVVAGEGAAHAQQDQYGEVAG